MGQPRNLLAFLLLAKSALPVWTSARVTCTGSHVTGGTSG